MLCNFLSVSPFYCHTFLVCCFFCFQAHAFLLLVTAYLIFLHFSLFPLLNLALCPPSPYHLLVCVLFFPSHPFFHFFSPFCISPSPLFFHLFQCARGGGPGPNLGFVFSSPCVAIVSEPRPWGYVGLVGPFVVLLIEGLCLDRR